MTTVAVTRKSQVEEHDERMCNAYSMTTTRDALRQLFRLESCWNQLRLPGIHPGCQAPIGINGTQNTCA